MTNAEENKTTFTITAGRAISIIIGAILTGAVSTVFTLGAVANSDHFTLIAHGQRITVLEKNVVPRTELVLELRNINDKLDHNAAGDKQTMEMLKDILQKLDTIE